VQITLHISHRSPSIRTKALYKKRPCRDYEAMNTGVTMQSKITDTR
jgi:hypothetical protein